MVSYDWKFVCEEIDRLIAKRDRQQTDFLAEGKINDAVLIAGEKIGLEIAKNLPATVRRENLGIVEKIKETISALAGK